MSGTVAVRRRWMRSALLATALALPTPLWAQSAPLGSAQPGSDQPNTAGTNGPESQQDVTQPADIVVTAQKRLQSLQDVPVSVEVLDNRKLDQLEVRDFRDYINFLPSISTSGANPGGNATVVARCIATDGGNYVQCALPTV